MAKEPKIREITFGSVMGWVVGLVLLLVGVALVFKSFVSGLMFLIAGLAVLPWSRRLLEEKARFRLSKGLTWVLVIVLLAVAIATMPKSTTSESAEVLGGYEVTVEGCTQACLDAGKKSMPALKGDLPQAYHDQCDMTCEQVDYQAGTEGIKTVIQGYIEE